MLLSIQIKAARGLLKMSQIELAHVTDLSIATIKKLENNQEALESANLKTVKKIKAILEERGIKFIPPKTENSLHGAGVKIIDPSFEKTY